MSGAHDGSSVMGTLNKFVVEYYLTLHLNPPYGMLEDTLTASSDPFYLMPSQ